MNDKLILFKMPKPFNWDAELEDLHYYRWLKTGYVKEQSCTDTAFVYLELHGFVRGENRLRNPQIDLLTTIYSCYFDKEIKPQLDKERKNDR